MTGDSGLVEGDGARSSWLQRLWFRLLLLFRRIARLFGAGETAQPVEPPSPEGFLFDRVPAGPPFDEVNHPTLRQLRRRALSELFDWLELDFLPGQLLERSDHSSDPVAALATFLRSVGCDPERVRRRDPEELDRLRLVIDLLMAFDSLTTRLPQGQRDSLQLLLFSGDFDRLRLASERLFVLSAILDSHAPLGETLPLASYDALIRQVEAAQGRLFELSRGEIEAFRAEAERWLRSARRRALLDAEVGKQRDALERRLARLPRSPAHAARLEALTARYGEIGSALSIDPALKPDEVAALLDETDALLESLQELLREVEEEAEAASRFQSEGATERLYRTEQEAALAFLGFPIDARPDATAIRAAWRRFMKDNHPDLTTDARDKQTREALCKDANLKRHILERAFTG